MQRFLVSALAGTALTVAGTAAAQDNLGPTMSEIQETGTIHIGNREASRPFSYINEDQEVVGYTIDICAHIVDSIEERLGQELEVNYHTITPQTRIQLINNGTIHMGCGSMTNTLTRQEQVDYSYITYITGTRILTKTDSDIDGIGDLEGGRIGVAQGTTNAQAVNEAIENRDLENVDVLDVRDHNEGFEALRTDRVDAYSTDDVLLYGLIENARNPDNYEVVGDFLSYDPYAIALPENDSTFRLQVNRVLADLYRSGQIDEIFNRWFEPMGIPLFDQMEANFTINALPE